MKYSFTLAALLMGVSLSAQSFEWDKKGADAGAQQQTALTEYEVAYNEKQIGLAGEYAPVDAGTATAYGERYAPELLTASHAILPLGTMVKVTNLSNNQSVIVRINDKKQTCQDCLITLSDAAAKQIGINLRARVSVEKSGFSNWNPSANGTATAPQPASYGGGKVASSPKTQSVGEPISINGETYGWDAPTEKAAPSVADRAIVRPAVYRDERPAPVTYGSSPSVLDREVVSGAQNSPADYVPAGAPVVSVASPAAAAYQTQTTAQTPGKQVAPPAPTVPFYQEGRTAPTPKNYPVPETAVIRNTPNRAAQPTPAIPATAQSAPATSPVATSGHVIQIGAYSNLDYAKNRVKELEQLGLPGMFYKSFTKADGSMLHRVYSGFYPTRLEAQQAEAYNRNTYQVPGVVTEFK